MIFLNLLLAFCIQSFAQDNIITPGDPNLKIEDRILKLEKAVQDLQKKNFEPPYQDPPTPVPTAPPVPAGTKYTCTLTVFGQTYVGHGKTKLQARDDVTFKCKNGNNYEVHCIKSECKEIK